MTTPHPFPPTSLHPALPTDIPSLIAVHTLAFRSDLFSALMLLNRPEGAHQVHMRRSVEEWLVDPKAQIIKAVDEDGDILGWACWITKDASPSSIASEEEEETKSEKEDAEGEETAKSGDEKKKIDPARVLGGLMYAEKVQHENKYLQGKKHIVLQALATAPVCQNQGIGTQLVNWGAELADAEGMMCWAHASPSGHKLYESVGFEEVGKSEFDLSEYAPGGKEGGRGWGVYTFRYMLRPVKTSN